MKDLVNVSVNAQGAQVVSARELYEFLEFNRSQWARWSKKNIARNPFARENEDWVGFDIMSNGNKSVDYALTLDFAKRLAMMAQSEKGEQVREYFLNCEKRLQRQSANLSKKANRYQRLGKDASWIEGRLQAVATRNNFTRTLGGHGVKNNGFRACTNAIYTPLYGGSTAVVRLRKGLSEKVNIRDNMNAVELAAVNLAELLATSAIESQGLYGNAQCELACNHASRSVATALVKNRKQQNLQ
ncbi:antA/AntB antirepressor family protein [Tellurirhabdus bombi]|uniref:antA/AntB antirepressor family protein n=1 Tax=Tellurirhabdus bombi TaxID=2907205 RepID=UPI001F37F712|nr:antA/AntB antirepressor family protein [Tellurirhabdus bombi]